MKQYSRKLVILQYANYLCVIKSFRDDLVVQYNCIIASFRIDELQKNFLTFRYKQQSINRILHVIISNWVIEHLLLSKLHPTL